MLTLQSMHDATLKGFKADWATGDLQFDFIIFKEDRRAARIIAKEFRNIECPRQSPWGRSNSVNKITEQKIENGVLLTIEMQSGDYIKAQVGEFFLEVGALIESKQSKGPE